MKRWLWPVYAAAAWGAFCVPAGAQPMASPSTSSVMTDTGPIKAPWVSTAPAAFTVAPPAPTTFMQEIWTSTESAPPPVLWLEHRIADTFDFALGPVGRSLHVAGVEFGGGFDTDSDLLKPFADRGFNELLAWDNRIVISDQGYGLHSQYRDPALFQKIAFSITEKQDMAALIGLGSFRDGTYRALDLTPQLPAHGYNVGAAAVLNPYVGFSTSYDRSKYFSDDDTAFTRRAAFGVGLSPLGTNQGKDWNVTIVPTLYYDWVDDLNAGIPDVKSGVGYSLGPDYYHGLERWHLPGFLQHVRPDRLDISLIYANTKAGGVDTSLSVNLTGYLTHWLKLSLGASLNYHNVVNEFTTTTQTGVSLRITLFDFPI